MKNSTASRLKLIKYPNTPQELAIASASTLALGAAGAVAGGSVAVGSVTVLGSSTLGSLAVSAGLLAPPLWPVAAGVLLGGGLAYTAVKALKHFSQRRK
ncbi:MAG: hypothetical protein ACOH2R_05795 [Pseudomonas sp.]